MKKIFTLLSLFFTITVFSQQWGPVGCGMGGSVYSMTFDSANHKIYLGGTFQNLLCPPYYSTVGIASTDGNVLSDVGGFGLRPFGSAVRASVMYQGKLIIGGLFDSVANVACKNIASWDGTQWDTLSSGMTDSLNAPCIVEALAVYNGDLYAAGRFTTAGGVPCSNIARWDGAIWNPVGTGITNAPNTLDEVYCMHTFNNRLYAGGYFNNAGGILTKDIASWDGIAWDSLGPGLTQSPNNMCGFVYAMQDYQNELYAVGAFRLAGNSVRPQIAKWNGVFWDSVGNGLNQGGETRALTVYRNKLIVAGNYDSIGNVRYDNIAAWDGNSWSHVGIPNAFDQDGTEIFSLCVMDSCLYAGGLINYIYNFTVYTPYLAKYCDGSEITSVHASFESNGMLMPVPVNDVLIFDPGIDGQMEIHICDVQSKIVREPFYITGKNEIDISGLSPGVYFLESNSSSGTFHYKFIKE